MNLNTLNYFNMPAEELHFGREAQRLQITQAPLSCAIKIMEEELGIVLFERNQRNVRLTPEDEFLRSGIAEIFSNISKLETSAKMLAEDKYGTVYHVCRFHFSYS